MPRNIIQVLQPSRTYHFDDACVFITRDDDRYSFIQRLLQHPSIPYRGTWNLRPIDVVVVAEKVAREAAENEAATAVQVEASVKVVDNTVVHGVFIDLTNIGVMGETSKGSNVAMADEVEPLIPDFVSKQSTTSNEATS